MMEREVTYDDTRGLATFRGPGGFTQVYMPESNARAIAEALNINFKIESYL